MSSALLLLFSLYSLPQGVPAPPGPPDPRLAAALAVLRSGSGEAVDAAVRELALLGESCLPAVVKRLNRADAGERLLLLSAVRRLPHGASLLDQARRDPHPAVRTWVAGPPPRREPSLRALAVRYVDLLAVAERSLRLKVDEDLQGRLGRPADSFAAMRSRAKDERVSATIQRRRRRAANAFAIAGEAALFSGAFVPDLNDPIFLAYLGLLREEEGAVALYHATRALVGRGARLDPICRQLLKRPNHDPRAILRLLFAVREDRGEGVYERFDSFRPAVQQVLLRLAPGVLEPAAMRALLEHAALLGDHDLRIMALDGLLSLQPPAGVAAARKLLDPALYGVGEFDRAARLLARAGKLKLLERYATLDLQQSHLASSDPLRSLRQAARGALRRATGPQAAALGRRLLASPRRDLRTLGLALVSDAAVLLDAARKESDEGVATAFAMRALDLAPSGMAPEVLALLQRRHLSLHGAFRILRRRGRIDLIVGLAKQGVPGALDALGDLESIDRRYEKDLLALYDRAPEAQRERAFDALLPLGTGAVKSRVEALGAKAIDLLDRRAEASAGIGFSLPLRRFIEGAGADRLQKLRRIAEALPEVEPGLFYDLLAALEALPVGEREAQQREAGVAQQKVRLLDSLARSGDRKSAALLFDELLRGRRRDPFLVGGILKAASRLVESDHLALLVPHLRLLAEEERARPEKLPPEPDLMRYGMLHAGIDALAQAHVTAALAMLCDFVLDPDLAPPAYDWEYESPVPWLALEALRDYSPSQVEEAFHAARQRAERSGRLARLAPERLMRFIRQCRRGRDRGRWLAEVALELARTLRRLPWEGDEEPQLMVALGALKHYQAAAKVARETASRERAQRFGPLDGSWTPERLEGQAAIYEAVATGDPKRLRQAFAEVSHDPALCYTVARFALFYLPDEGLAAQAAEAAVRKTAGLFNEYRDTLALVRIRQGRPRAAMRLLDPQRSLPVKRSTTSGWHLLWQARARLELGDRLKARYDLWSALTQDRRIEPFARKDNAFQGLAEVFQAVDEEFFDRLFAGE